MYNFFIRIKSLSLLLLFRHTTLRRKNKTSIIFNLLAKFEIVFHFFSVHGLVLNVLYNVGSPHAFRKHRIHRNIQMAVRNNPPTHYYISLFFKLFSQKIKFRSILHTDNINPDFSLFSTIFYHETEFVYLFLVEKMVNLLGSHW